MSARHAIRRSMLSAIVLLTACSVRRTLGSDRDYLCWRTSQFQLGNDAFAPCERFKYKDGRLSLRAAGNCV